ncbi:uncharacterized protein LOC117224742 isoform X1 [Megalopta genalis]|uniref:uncharacterized protein LOC117224742 isoform X1 n=1 Tax=Megalopta genalis TaxID=115081 RepID=UPI003FD41684
MDKRLDTTRSSYQEDASTHSKKARKRSNKKSSMLGPWMNNISSNQNSDMVPGMEYQQVMWQSNIQQNIQSNGQRLFTAASDPSMCGYAQMPMTYTMEPVSLPTMYRVYQPVPFSGVRTIHNRPRRHYNQNHPLNMGVNTVANGYTSLQENGMESPMPINYQNGDYTSLPPTANKTNEINGDEPNSEHRRYSDPGLGSADTPAHTQSEDSDSVGSGSSITTIGRSNKLILSLIEQMTELKKSNSQLFKDLNETKSELGSMKTKFAQCKYNTSSDYQPGMLSDLIREIRQANKTCEEGLVIKVKSMLEEKLNERSSEVTSLSNQVLKLIEEKAESERRIAKLEDEVAALKLQANNEGREIAAFEEETLALRRELQEARASKTLAETHVAKCVNARSATPVSFETPYETSTPVRTALSDTCSLIPSVVPTSVPTLVPFLRNRPNGEELAHHQFVNEKSSPYRSPMLDTWPEVEETTRTPVTSSQPALASSNGDREDGTLEETSSLTSTDNPSDVRKEDSGHETESIEASRNLEDKEAEKTNEDTVAFAKNDGDKVDSVLVCTEVDEGIASSLTENKTKSSRTEASKEDGIQRVQRGSSKKSRKKKGMSKRSFSEADRTAEGASCTAKDRRTVSEDEHRLDDGGDDASRAITEIPEVTVVGGGSFVPKDLCSTRILTSRVLTAPSRATYTTAYI